VERALTNMKAELIRDMKLMGAQSLDDLGRDNLRFR
jgi:L-lactate dehydrogenase (cytochrome)